MTAQQLLSVLEDARTAQRAGDFLNALKFYEQFFDHALDHDPAALYGIRLNHCLDGWAALAASFPGALNSLRDKQAEALALYRAQREPERFHDYLQISARLHDTPGALQTFVQLYEDNPKSAAKLAKFVWDDLVSSELWGICNKLLEQPALKLEELFALFDEAMRLKEIDATFDCREFEQHTVDQLLTNLQNVVTVLRHGERGKEIKELERQFFQSVQTRDNATLNKQINATGAYLFAAH